MNIIQLKQAPSQEFGVGDHRVRLNYNYLANVWSFTLFDADRGVVLTAGNFIKTGMNLLEAVGGSLIAVDSVSCPQNDWYRRLVMPYADDIPQTVLVYDV